MPGDLHKLWRTRDRKGYHVEYGFSCMGYEIAGGLGVKMAALDAGEDRDVFVMVGDGSYLMMAQEIVTAVAGGREADRGAGAEPRLRLDRRAVGVARVAALRHPLPLPHRRPASTATCCRSTWPRTPRASARDVISVQRRSTSSRRRFAEAQAADVTTVDPRRDRPARSRRRTARAWWDVPVAEVADAGVDARRPRGVRGAQADAAQPPAPRHETRGTTR